MLIMTEKYFMLDLDDERAGAIADVMQNKTCKKILSHLAEHDSSEGDLVKNLGLPATTVHYGIKKLIDAGFVTVSNSMWSVKGKKIPIYRVSEKKIVISPKKSTSGKILATLGLTGLAALSLKILYSGASSVNSVTQDAYYGVAESAKVAATSAPSVGSGVSPDQILATPPIPEIWVWFLFGGIFALFMYMILNWRRL
jgi:DNA-binding transcriptional ArsR family regulator